MIVLDQMAEAVTNSTLLDESSDVHVLLIEDNESDALLARKYLTEFPERNFFVKWVNRLSDAIQVLKSSRVDLILLDLSLPDSDGLQTLSALMAHSSKVPIVVLTGNLDQKKGVEAVRMGAQDYLVKGRASFELLARSLILSAARFELKATPILRSDDPEKFLLKSKHFTIDLKRQIVISDLKQGNGEECALNLTPIEFRILVHLFQSKPNAVSRDQIVEQVWGNEREEIVLRTVDRHLSSLKKKCKPVGINIQTIYGTGYKLEINDTL